MKVSSSARPERDGPPDLAFGLRRGRQGHGGTESLNVLRVSVSPWLVAVIIASLYLVAHLPFLAPALSYSPTAVTLACVDMALGERLSATLGSLSLHTAHFLVRRAPA